jgi:hypothetical protein
MDNNTLAEMESNFQVLPTTDPVPLTEALWSNQKTFPQNLSGPISFFEAGEGGFEGNVPGICVLNRGYTKYALKFEPKVFEDVTLNLLTLSTWQLEMFKPGVLHNLPLEGHPDREGEALEKAYQLLSDYAAAIGADGWFGASKMDNRVYDEEFATLKFDQAEHEYCVLTSGLKKMNPYLTVLQEK